MKKTKYTLAQLSTRLTTLIASASLLLLPFTFQSCDNETTAIGTEVEEGKEENVEKAEFGMTYGSDMINIMANASLYVFKHQGNPVKVLFDRKLNNVTTEITGTVGNEMGKMTTQLEVAKWDIALLGAETNITAKNEVKIPAFDATEVNKAIGTALMWETSTYKIGTKDYLNQTPELLYSRMANVTMTKDATTTVPTKPVRVVSKIIVILESHIGFAPHSELIKPNASYIELDNVPSQLNWSGNLFTGTKKGVVRSALTFDLVGGVSKAKNLEFIIPADNVSAPGQLKLRACMPIGSVGSVENFIRETDLTQLAKPNKVIQVTIKTFSGEPAGTLNIAKIVVKDWDQEEDLGGVEVGG